MVTAVTSLGRNGLADWLIQRASAVVMAVYTLTIVGYLLMHPDPGFALWSQLFSHLWMRVFTLLVILSVVAHGWIGLWVVLTDYMTERLIGASALLIRTAVMGLYALVSITVLVWGVEIVWGF